MADAILVLNAGSSSLKFSLFVARRAPSWSSSLRGQAEGLYTSPALRRQGRARASGLERSPGTKATRSATTARSPTSSTSCASQPAADTGSSPSATAWCTAGSSTHAAGAGRRPRCVRALREARSRSRRCTSRTTSRRSRRCSQQMPDAAAGGLLRHRVPPRAAGGGPGVRAARRRSPTAACAATASTACPTSTSPACCRRVDARAAAAARVVVAHLGNGASMCAMQAGRSVASTMGFTAVDGLPMGTRCGALDPGVVLYLMDELQDGRAGHREADLPAVGAARRLRHLERHARAAGERRRRGPSSAVDLFVYRIGRELGSLAAALGGLDALVFTGGIGEHAAADPRARLSQDAAWLGVELDAAANAAAGRASAPPAAASPPG